MDMGTTGMRQGQDGDQTSTRQGQYREKAGTRQRQERGKARGRKGHLTYPTYNMWLADLEGHLLYFLNNYYLNLVEEKVGTPNQKHCFTFFISS